MALKSTGYQTTATTVTWASGQTLDSAIDNEWTDLSDEIDNSTNKYTMADFRIALGSAAFTGSDSAILLYIVPSVDGTNYPKWTGNATTEEPQNEGFFRGSQTTTGATETQELAYSRVALPPGKWKVGLRNVANVTLAGSGNTVQWRPHSFEDV